MTLKPTLACNRMHSRKKLRRRERDRTVKKCEFFYESSESSSVVSILLTVTRAVCIIYFAALRIFPSLYVSPINDRVVIFPSQID